jgi:hypothetical protein
MSILTPRGTGHLPGSGRLNGSLPQRIHSVPKRQMSPMPVVASSFAAGERRCVSAVAV